MSERQQFLERGAYRINKAARVWMEREGVRWYVLLVLSGKELLAQKALNRQGIVSYLPLQRKWQRINRYRRERKGQLHPVISGCLFVGFQEDAECWPTVFGAVSSAYGVLGSEGFPVALPGYELIAFLEGNKGKFCFSEGERPKLKIGDRVCIVGGPLSGLTVDVKDIKGRRARILVAPFGEERNIEILIDKLECSA